MNEKELKRRTKFFSPRALELVDSLPDTRSGRVLANEPGRAGTSVGANYRAACRSRSEAEMISKFAIVEEEADECCFRLELMTEHGLLSLNKLAALLGEANEITAIMVASRRTLAAKRSKIAIQKSKIR